jgi:hypothetical protein
MAILCGLAIESVKSQRQGELFYYSNLLKKMVAVRKKVFSDTKFAAFNPDYVCLTNLPGYQKIRL